MTSAAIWLRRAAWTLLMLLLAAAALTGRVVYDGEREMRLSDAAFDRGDVRLAATHARRAAVLYAPGAPHVGPAYARLVAIATGAEAAGDIDVAKMAWRSVRGAALETRHLWIVHRAELERANGNLARLQCLGSEANADSTGMAKAALAELRQDDAPRSAWIGLLVVGFSLAVAGLFLVAWRGVTPAGALVPSRAKLGILLALIGAACWTVAAYQA